jgi:ribosomal-protein-alanine N-acetyltransferase
VVGRANHKDIDRERGMADVGYRVAETSAGRGHASLALAHLLQLAREQWSLPCVQAFASIDNPASVRVLEKAGFRCVESVPGLAEVGGRKIDGHRYELVLPTSELT